MSLEDLTQWPPPMAPPPPSGDLSVPQQQSGGPGPIIPPPSSAAPPPQSSYPLHLSSTGGFNPSPPPIIPQPPTMGAPSATGGGSQPGEAAPLGAGVVASTTNLLQPGKGQVNLQQSTSSSTVDLEQAKDHLRLRMKVAALEAEVVRLNMKLRNQPQGSPTETQRESPASLLIGRNVERRNASGTPTAFSMSADGLTSSLHVDPLVATEIRTLRERLYSTETNLKQLQDDWRIMTTFNSEGPIGVRLLEKVRKLLKENEVLGEALMVAKVAAGDQQQLTQTEREAFLLNHLKMLFEFNAELENECSSLVMTVNQLAVANQGLKAENTRLEMELHKQQRDRSVPRNANGPVGGSSARDLGPPGGGGGAARQTVTRSPPRRERSPSAERRRRSGRRARE